MALLMPEGEHATWEGLSQGLLSYYNSPGRLAVFRRRFDNVTRWEGEDPSAFATELEILVCGLRRHLDSVRPDMPRFFYGGSPHNGGIP